MVKKVTLSTMNEDFRHTWKAVDVDVCNSHTIIYLKDENIRLVSPVESISVMPGKFVVYYKSGFYLVINI